MSRDAITTPEDPWVMSHARLVRVLISDHSFGHQ